MAIGSERVMLVAVMRNEGPYILEWLSHHFALGVDELLIFTNHCTDLTDQILDRLEYLLPHRVKHQPNPKIMFPNRGQWHIMALRYAGHFGRYRAADWIYATDADELLILKNGCSTLDDLYEATGGFDAISFTSVAFNSNGQSMPAPAPVRERFTQTSLKDPDGGDAISGVKTLFRNSVSGARRPHRPVTPAFSTTGQRWVNGSGTPLPPTFTDGHVKHQPTAGTRAFAQYNHYMIKSAGEFLLKVDRGDAVNQERLGASAQYWAHANRPGCSETIAVEMSPAARDLYEAWLADPVLGRLHAESFDIRRKRLEEILATEAGAELAEQIGFVA
ncbi:MAG: glycosyltransferase family 2 protein [Pseudomonadota bacterium]